MERPFDEIEKAHPPSHRMLNRTGQTVVFHGVNHVIPDSKDYRRCLFGLTSCIDEDFVESKIITITEEHVAAGERCVFTHRPFELGDKTRRVALVFEVRANQTDPQAEEGPAPKQHARVHFLDHGLVGDRLSADHRLYQRAKDSNLRVSDLGIHMFNFSTFSRWVDCQYQDDIEAAQTCASGTLSHEVLREQRERRKKTGSKPPPVLKKNKPDQWKERTTAFHNVTCTGPAVERIVDTFKAFKNLEISFLFSLRMGESLRHKD